MSGHVFVAHSDITRLRCDAWLLPTDAFLQITPAWLESAPPDRRGELASSALRHRWGNRSSPRTLAIDPWYPALGSAPPPVPVLTDVGAWSGKKLDWYLDGVSEFVQTAGKATRRSLSWRSKPLFAVPFVGSGAGGQSTQKGKLQRAILERLERESTANDVDLVLVLSNNAAFTAAQAVRRTTARWPFSESEKERLDALGSHASHGRLVLFIGAGLSRSAGLPLWSELLAGCGKRVLL